MDPRPIGVFDSGLGGLTAAKTLEEILPGENLIYFGDSANAPYGTRTKSELAALACGCAGFLAGFDVKAVLVACGTVSSTAMDALRERFDIPFFGVLEPACAEAARMSPAGRIAVAATEASVRSGAFAKTLERLAPGAAVLSKACQSLVTLVERGHFAPGDPAADEAVRAELAPVRDFAPDVLVLGCTHFPLLADAIGAYLGPEVKLLSVGEAAARALRAHLAAEDLLAEREAGERRWFTSGDPADFAAKAARFLGHGITAEHHGNT